MSRVNIVGVVSSSYFTVVTSANAVPYSPYIRFTVLAGGTTCAKTLPCNHLSENP